MGSKGKGYYIVFRIRWRERHMILRVVNQKPYCHSHPIIRGYITYSLWSSQRSDCAVHCRYFRAKCILIAPSTRAIVFFKISLSTKNWVLRDWKSMSLTFDYPCWMSVWITRGGRCNIEVALAWTRVLIWGPLSAREASHGFPNPLT